MMKVSVLGLLTLSLGTADAFLAPTSQKASHHHHIVKKGLYANLNGPQNGGLEGSNYLPGNYDLVGRDNPWGNRNPNGGVGAPPPGYTDMPSHLGGTNEERFFVPPPTTPGPGQFTPAGGRVQSNMKVARGQIYSVTGGMYMFCLREGSACLIPQNDRVSATTSCLLLFFSLSLSLSGFFLDGHSLL